MYVFQDYIRIIIIIIIIIITIVILFLFIFITTIIIININITLSIYLFLTNYSFILCNRISSVFRARGKGKGERKWVRIGWGVDWGGILLFENLYITRSWMFVCVEWGVRGEGGRERNWVGMKEGEGGRVDRGEELLLSYMYSF